MNDNTLLSTVVGVHDLGLFCKHTSIHVSLKVGMQSPPRHAERFKF